MSVERRYDIDWLRVIAIGLLLLFHITLIFQPWGSFIQSEESSGALHTMIAVFYLWRIPLLFFISGMGVCFAMRRRNWKELLKDRALRILLPLAFGSFFIVPIHEFIYQLYYGKEIAYLPGLGHLWFLLNILIYVTQIIGFAWLDQKYNYKIFNTLRDLLKKPFFVYIFVIPFIVEAEITNPQYFAYFIDGAHGFLIGMLAFFTGFLFIALGESLWNALNKVKYISLIIAVVLYFFRILYFEYDSPNYLSAIECINWIFALFGFAYKYLNRPGKVLSYLSGSAYPVYIVHMIFMFIGAYFVLPLELPLTVNFLLITLITFSGSFASYELIKRVKFLRPLFGISK